MRAFACAVLGGLVLVMTAPAGCGSSSGGSGFCGSDCEGDGGARSGDGGDLFGEGSAGAQATLTIKPATADLQVTDLTNLPKISLEADATYGNAAPVPVAASWTVDRLDIASVGAGDGVVTATGGAFGAVKVTATAVGASAQATINVRLTASTNPGNVSPGDQAKLTAATTADPSVGAFVYPYDKTVFPRGLLPPEQMWNGGAAGDAYLVHFVAPSFDLSVFTKADPPSRYTLPTSLWNAFTTSGAGNAATIELRRLSQGSAFVSAKQTWTIADANLRGTIYYWAINEGQIVKIDLPTGTRAPVFDSGPSASLGAPVPVNSGSPLAPPWQDTGTGKRCVACHSVSKDGSTLTSVFSRAGSTGPLGVVSLASAQTTAIGDYTQSTFFDALTPDGKLAVLNTTAKKMQLVDTTNGQPVATALDGLSDLCDPVFSPDGTKLALAANCDSGYGSPVEFRKSDLAILDFAAATRTFSNQRTVIAGGGLGDALAFPSFSPDSSWIFFQRGDYSRAKYGNANQHGNDDLFVVRAQPGAAPIALDAANGKGVLSADSAHLNYAPTVNPIAEGGYAWVVFTTPRDYGNRMVSPAGPAPSDATYSNHKQLWVTAVDTSVTGADPSHPAFWLPGQDSASINMFGYWSLAPCKKTQGDGGPATCSAGFECCSGFCRDTGNGPVCIDNPGGCHQVGEACTSDGDCCGGGAAVGCVAGVCQKRAVK